MRSKISMKLFNPFKEVVEKITTSFNKQEPGIYKEIDEAINMLVIKVKDEGYIETPVKTSLLVGNLYGKELRCDDTVRINIELNQLMQKSTLDYVSTKLQENGLDIQTLHGSDSFCELILKTI